MRFLRSLVAEVSDTARSTPQHYAAFTRERKKLAQAELTMLEKNNLTIHSGFPVMAVMDGQELNVTRRGGDTLAPMRALAALADEHPDNKDQPQKKFAGKEVINHWVAQRLRAGVHEQCDVYVILENPDAPKAERRTSLWTDGGWIPRHRTSAWMLHNTIRTSSYLYGFAEEKALKKLRSLISPELYETYILTGTLLEEGKSGVMYYIRKSRPTLAWRIVPHESANGTRAHGLAALCMHPGGYFSRTWTGFLPPTDEVVAHLLLIRHSEHRYWKVCHQHPIDDVEAGL